MYTYMAKFSELYLNNLNLDRAGRAPDAVFPPVQEPDSPGDCFLNGTCFPGNWTNSTASSVGLSEVAAQTELIGYVYVMPVLCVICVVLNSLTVVVFNQSAFQSRIYSYMIALSIADVITGLVTMPIGMTRCGACGGGVTLAEMIYEVFVFVPISNMSECASAWFVISLAVERLLAVSCMSSGKASTAAAATRSRITIAAVTVASIALNMPYFFIIQLESSPYPMAVQTDFGASLAFDVFSWIRASLVQFGPLVLLVLFNCWLLYELRKSSKRYKRLVRKANVCLRKRAEHRLTLMLLGTVLLFIVGNIPVAFSFTVLFTEVFGQSVQSNDLYAIFRVCAHLVAIASYALDFVVYCGINRHFKEALQSAFSCKSLERRVSSTTPSSKASLSPNKF